MRLALAQLNLTVGDLEGNLRLIQDSIDAASRAGADLVAVPELALTGYPPEDLLLQRSFVQDNLSCLDELAKGCFGIVAVVGFVDERDGLLFNAAAFVAEGKVQGVYHKHHLPNYGVFDEARYFRPGGSILVEEASGTPVGITVCEDLWSEDGPQAASARAGASLVVNINASPYHRGKGGERHGLVRKRAVESGACLAYVNLVGGQDELVFDGQSLVVSGEGELLARASQFTEELLIVDLPRESARALSVHSAEINEPGHPAEASVGRADAGGESASGMELGGAESSPEGWRLPKTTGIAPELDEEAEVYGALVLGLRDYLHKNGFKQALVGLSGGIDSALTAAVAVDALGASNVLGVSNPSRYTSQESILLAEELAKTLGIELVALPISQINETILETLEPVFAGTGQGIAEENIQARIRGLLWMAISNKSRRIVLATGNKSELSVGYATLYGDMAGGYAVLKDVPKTLVFKLARWRNRQGAAIPQAIIERPPTAELREDQLDTDSLPPYEVLDPILESYVERDLSIEQIVQTGFDEATVKRVAEMVDRAEYKRRQAPPGIKITERAFGKDRRLPITNRYRRTRGFSLPR